MSFNKYQAEDSVISAESIVKGLFNLSGQDIKQIVSFYTSSALNKDFYLAIFSENPSVNASASVQFYVQHGHISGSGSVRETAGDGTNYSRIIYGQYRNLIYGSENSEFDFGGDNGSSEDVFIINFSRSRFKESIYGGSLGLKITSGSNIIQLTDNSFDLSTSQFISSNRYYDLVSGSDGRMRVSSSVLETNSGSYGFVFPDMGLIVLNGSALKEKLGFVSLNRSSSINSSHNNSVELFKMITSASAQSVETITSKYFFTRVKNAEFNYTTNPSIIDDNGNLLYSSLIDNPQTYITTIGLYNDNNELLAVAKVSRPIVKDFTKEALLRVKLDF